MMHGQKNIKLHKTKVTRTCLYVVCRHLIQYVSVHVTSMGDVCPSLSLLCAGLSVCLGSHEALDGYLRNSVLPAHYTFVSNDTKISDGQLVDLHTFVGAASLAESARCL